MSPAAWVEIGAVAAYALVLLWIIRWPIASDDWDKEQDAAFVCDLEEILDHYSAAPVDGDQLAIDRTFAEIVERL